MSDPVIGESAAIDALDNGARLVSPDFAPARD